LLMSISPASVPSFDSLTLQPKSDPVQPSTEPQTLSPFEMLDLEPPFDNMSSSHIQEPTQEQQPPVAPYASAGSPGSFNGAKNVLEPSNAGEGDPPQKNTEVHQQQEGIDPSAGGLRKRGT